MYQAISDVNRHYVYIVECRDGTLYTGYTTDVARRVEIHNAGKGARYTRGRTPVRLLYVETCVDKGEALRRELAIKRMSKQAKTRLVERVESRT